MAEYIVSSDQHGNKFWHNADGQFHRTDGPAIEYASGTKAWWINGQRHRDNGPAVEYVNGAKEWYTNGQYHREDGPAVENANGNKHWYINGQRHRTDGPAVEYANGKKLWYVGGTKQNVPAIDHHREVRTRRQAIFRSMKKANDGIVLCYCCKKPVTENEATVEHIIPKMHGGTDRITNLAISHEKCNNLRGSSDNAIYLKIMQTYPEFDIFRLDKQDRRAQAKIDFQIMLKRKLLSASDFGIMAECI